MQTKLTLCAREIKASHYSALALVQSKVRKLEFGYSDLLSSFLIPSHFSLSVRRANIPLKHMEIKRKNLTLKQNQILFLGSN